MVDEVLCQCLESVRVAQDRVHLRIHPLALFDGVVTGSILGTAGVVILNFFQLTVIQKHLSGTSFVNDAHRDFIPHRLRHRVGIHHRPEDIQCGIDRRAREADVGGVG